MTHEEWDALTHLTLSPGPGPRCRGQVRRTTEITGVLNGVARVYCERCRRVLSRGIVYSAEQAKYFDRGGPPLPGTV